MFVQPARHHCPLEMRIQHKALCAGTSGIVQVQVVVGQATVPISTGWCARNVVNRLQHKRNGTAGLQGQIEIGVAQIELARWIVAAVKRQGCSRRREDDALEPAAKSPALHQITEPGTHKAQCGAIALLASEQLAPVRREDVQPKAGMRKYFLNTPVVKGSQTLTKQAAYRGSRWSLLTGIQFIVLTDVVMFKPQESCYRFIQAGCSHAPRANRSTDQMHLLV